MSELKAVINQSAQQSHSPTMRVRIVCYEDVHEWILGKFARQLCENLQKQGVATDISKTPDPTADINHHIIYWDYPGEDNGTDTMMITHIDTAEKEEKLRRQFVTAKMGICMSSDTMHKLTRLGIQRAKLCYVNPAHDGLMKPRKLVVGITSKVQLTGCKREAILLQLAEVPPANEFKFWIMGSGWDDIVHVLRTRGIEVEYCDRFDYDRYHTLMPLLDYYLYFGQDEGSMGFIDALAAGIPTIVTPQGYHLDAKGGIVYPFNEVSELIGIFRSISEKRRRLVDAISTWTWSAYAHKHMMIWQYLLCQKDGRALPSDLQRELPSLGVTLDHRRASLQTLAHRILRTPSRIARLVKRRLRAPS